MTFLSGISDVIGEVNTSMVILIDEESAAVQSYKAVSAHSKSKQFTAFWICVAECGYWRSTWTVVDSGANILGS